MGAACKAAQAEGLMVGGAAFRLRAAAHAVERCSLRGRLVHLLVLQQRRSTLNVRLILQLSLPLACRKARLVFQSTTALDIPVCFVDCMYATTPEKCGISHKATSRCSNQGS